jgi:hypothetical protein
VASSITRLPVLFVAFAEIGGLQNQSNESIPHTTTFRFGAFSPAHRDKKTFARKIFVI